LFLRLQAPTWRMTNVVFNGSLAEASRKASRAKTIQAEAKQVAAKKTTGAKK
jgi:hypothetical protein